MRFLIFSDLHIHAHPDFDVQVGHSSSRLLDCLNVLNKVKEYYDKYKCSAVLFCGDMFHVPRAVETSIYEPAFRRLEQLTENVKVFIAIAGNHDKADVSRGGPSYSSVYPVSRLSNSYIVVKDSESIELGKTIIHCLPYIKDNQEFTESIERAKSRVEKDKTNLAITHCSLNEATNGPNEIRLKDAWSIEELRGLGDYVFCGHHHHPQRLDSKSIVVGSPIQHNMLDRGDRRGLVIYDTNTRQVKRIWLNFSRFFLFESHTPTDIGTIDWNWLHDGYVRFIFRYSPTREVLSLVENHIVNAGARAKEIKIQRAPLNSVRNEKLTLQLVKSNDFKSSIPEFVQHVKPVGLNIKRLIETGQKLIDKSKL